MLFWCYAYYESINHNPNQDSLLLRAKIILQACQFKGFSTRRPRHSEASTSGIRELTAGLSQGEGSEVEADHSYCTGEMEFRATFLNIPALEVCYLSYNGKAGYLSTGY
ncbi:unnamed protein product [Caretta caretta]